MEPVVYDRRRGKKSHLRLSAPRKKRFKKNRKKNVPPAATSTSKLSTNTNIETPDPSTEPDVKSSQILPSIISSPYSSYAPMHLEVDHNESPNSETVDVKPFIHNSWFAMNAASSHVVEPNPLSLQNEDNSSYNGFTADESSAYFHFFRGIHSEFLELSPKRQRQFKRKCLDYLHELLDEEDNNHQHGYSHQDNVLNLSNSVHMSVEERDVKPVVENACTLSSN